MQGAGIIRNAGIIRGRVLYEEIRYFDFLCEIFEILGELDVKVVAGNS